MPAGECVCMTQCASGAAAWIAPWMAKPAAFTGHSAQPRRCLRYAPAQARSSRVRASSTRTSMPFAARTSATL